MTPIRLRSVFLWSTGALVGLPQAVHADKLLFSYDADVHPASPGGGFETFDPCSPPNCSESLENGHFVIQWGQFSDQVNYHHGIAGVDDAPESLWVEWRFRSIFPLPPGDDACDAAVHVQFRAVGEPLSLHGNAAVSFSGSEAFTNLPLNEFYVVRFESYDGTSFTYSANGYVFTGQTQNHVLTSSIQFQGVADCDRPANVGIRNEWDFIRHGTLTDGEIVVATDPPSGLVDSNEYPNFDRFLVTFDQPGFVYVDDITVVSSVAPPPQVRWVRRLDNGPPNIVEIVLDAPLPRNVTTTFTLDTGGEPQTITYAYLVLGSCCLPLGRCIQTDEFDCAGQGGTLTAAGQCKGDTDGDGVDISCGDQCDMDPNKTIPGQCGCGTPDFDSDGDTVADCRDQCDGEDDTIDDDANGTPDCAQFQPIPTTSVWGLGIMALLLLIGAKLGFGRKTTPLLPPLVRGEAQRGVLPILVLFGFLCAAAEGATRYAKTDGSSSGNCDSWSAACTLDRARTVAASGDEIWVKAGTYGPFALKNGVKIIGGFAGTETAASQSNPATNVTIVDGGDQDQCVTGNGEGPTTMLRGFTIRNCDISSISHGGAGIHLEDSSARIVQCIIEENNALYFGGGATIRGTGTPEFINCTFRNNGAGTGTGAKPYGGGAVHVYSGSPKFTNCLFHDNIAGEGAAVANIAGMPTFINCTFTQNSAEFGTAGAIFDSEGQATVQNSILWNNSAAKGSNEILNRTGITSNVTHSDIQGGYTGAGNINSDPLFVNAAGDDFKLTSCSPCRNAGSNSLLPADVGDLDWDSNTTETIPKDLALGNRKVGGLPAVVDMGAYEGPAQCIE